MLTLWFSVPRCERTTHPQTVLWPVPLHRDDNMGEEILHPDRQPAGAAQQGEGGETSSHWCLNTCPLAFIGKRRRQLSSSPLYFTHESFETCARGKGEKEILCWESDETLEQVAQRGCGRPILAGVQGQAG